MGLSRALAAAVVGALASAVYLAAALPGPPELWARLDFNAAPFEDFIGPYFETARALPEASEPAPGYLYPAFFALLLAPLARLGPEVASWVWLAVEVLATLLLWLLPLRLAPPKRARDAAAYGALAMLAHPVLHNLYWGQVSTPIAALLLAGVAAGARGRARLEGVAVGVATAIKLTPALFLLGPLVRGRRVTVVAGVACAALCLVLPALALMGGGDAWSFHREVAARLAAVGARVTSPELGVGSQDVAAAFSRWLPEFARFPSAGFLAGRAVGLALAVWLLHRARTVEDAGLRFAHAYLLLPLLVSPTWPHGLAGVPAACWFAWRAAGATPLSKTFAAAGALLLSMPIHGLFDDPTAYARAGIGAAATLCAVAALLSVRDR